MQTLSRVTLASVIKQPDIRQDNGVDTKVDRGIDGLLPFADPTGLCKSVDGHQHLPAAAMGITDAFTDPALIKIQSGEVARIGRILEAEINGIGTVIDRGFKRRQAAGRTNEIGQGAHRVLPEGKLASISVRVLGALILVKVPNHARIHSSLFVLVSTMAVQRVLIVDDESLNLLIIENYLDEENLQLELFSDPVAAWNRLHEADASFDLVVLDRMMPELDGMEFLRRMKQETRFVDIPVIMQTAASAPEQVREGLEAGAYYYLTKPYAPEALISIVRAAVDAGRSRAELRFRAAHLEDAQRLLHCAEYRFSNLMQVATLVPVLAAFGPEPDRVAPGLSDLMVNAIEHGNLGITYQEKSLLRWEGDWEAEVDRRYQLPQFRDRVATVRVERHADAIVFTISDQGNGFDWARYLDFDPARAFDPNGRGIAMARLTSFSSLNYLGVGNVVVARIDLDAGS